MPSFEHTNTPKSHSQADTEYQPGQNRPQPSEDETSPATSFEPTTQPLVSRVADVAAERVMAENQIPEEPRPSRFIDAHLGDPGPSIMQHVRKVQPEAGPRKPGLRGRGAAAPQKTGAPAAGAIGLVSNPSEVKEVLSGSQANAPQPRSAPPPAKGSSENGARQASAPSEARPSPAGERPPRQPRQDRPPRRERPEGKPREPRPPRQDHPSGPRGPRAAAPRPAAPAPEPKGLLAKVKKLFGNLFGGTPAQEPAKPGHSGHPSRENPRQHGPRPHHPGQKQGQGQGQPNAEGRPPRRRRRRGGRGGQNHRPSPPSGSGNPEA